MSGKPPPYVPPLEQDLSMDIGYPPSAGYPPPGERHTGYPGYPPPPQQYGFPTAPTHGYPAPPPQGYPYQPPQPVMVINNQPPPMHTANQTVVVNTNNTVQRQGINHCMHCCISIFFFPWLFVWLCLCICE